MPADVNAPGRRKRHLLLAGSLLLLAGAGCAAGVRGPTAALRAGDPARARDLAREKLARDEKDAESWRDLGIALYELDRPEEALDPLGRALALEPRGCAALLFRARTRDRLGRARQAIAAYAGYLTEAQGKNQTSVVRGRVEQIRRELIEEEVRRALAHEDSLRGAATPENGLAVPDFANLAASDAFRPVGKGLALMLAIDLSRIEPLRVLERHRLRTLLEELHRVQPEAAGREGPPLDPASTVRGQQQRLAALSDPNTGQPYYEGPSDGLLGPGFTSAVLAFQRANLLEADGVAGQRTQRMLDDLCQAQPARGAGDLTAFDPESAPRIARLLRARRIVQGSVLPTGADGLELRVDLLDALAGSGTAMRTGATGGETPATEPVGGPFREILRLEKRLAVEILRLLGIPVGGAERRVLEQYETRDLDAFLAFCRGLDLDDRGMRNEALAAYREAAARDPGFTLAETYGEALAVDSGALLEAETREIHSMSSEAIDVSRVRAD